MVAQKCFTSRLKALENSFLTRGETCLCDHGDRSLRILDFGQKHLGQGGRGQKRLDGEVKHVCATMESGDIENVRVYAYSIIILILLYYCLLQIALG